MSLYFPVFTQRNEELWSGCLQSHVSAYATVYSRTIPSWILRYESSSKKPENIILPAWAIRQPSDITHVTLNK